MKHEDEPITDDEWILRRVEITRFRNDTTPIISPNAFEPRIKGTHPDLDGISFFRLACLNDPLEIITPGKEQQFGIVRLQVQSLRMISLSVQSRPVPNIVGHVVIPELNATDYQQDKPRFKPQMLRLAELASEVANIIHWPAPP